MVGLRAKLRAKFPRRNSGIQSVSTSKSSNNSTHTSESRREAGASVGSSSSRPQSSENGRSVGPRPLSNDGGADASKLKSVGGRGGRGGSHSGKREAQATEPPLGAPASAVVVEQLDRDRDRASHQLRRHANQGRNTAQVKTADVRDTTTILSNNIEKSDSSSCTDESDDDSDDTGYLSVPPSSQESTTPTSNTRSKPRGSGTDTTSRRGSGSAKAPQNAANNSSTSNPGSLPIARTKMQQSDPTPGAPISTAATADATGRSKLSSIDEHLHVAGSNASPKQPPPSINASIDWKPTPPPTAPVAGAAAAAVAVDATVAAESVRRIRLTDPPIYLDSATPTTKPSLPITNQSGSLRALSSSSASPQAGVTRRQSLLPSRQDTLIRTLLSAAQAEGLDPAGLDQFLPISGAMVTRKIWVRRPGASATMVTINEDDLVDDVRDMILKKYANSLGRHFDAPDLTLRIAPREQQRQERVLGPDEPMARTLDAYFPGGQSVEEALIIDIPVPQRRTPKASPKAGSPHGGHMNPYFDEARPAEASTDYFGPEAMASLPATVAGTVAVANGTTHPHTISVLNTGQLPQIPSPGGGRPRAYRDRPDRPRLGRQHTSSPTILNVVGAGSHAATIAVAANHGTQQAARVPRSRTHSNASSDQSNQAPAPPPAPPLPSPPAPETAPVQIQRAVTPPPPRVASPRPVVARPKKKKTADHPALPAGMLNGGVPPISVLIVEDNIINLRLLEAFVKRLKVRWQTAMNGRDAVTKWRTGGFHLVLMDIQLPIMSGLEATREIRRLERINQIGAFSTSKEDSSETKKETPEADILPNREMFKSPVIIVALTASSLQSDRHEALAAGCNDFLTKVSQSFILHVILTNEWPQPVTYVWLERKVMEWGCMQALIDFDGWRKWKDFAPKVDEDAVVPKKPRTKKGRSSVTTSSSETH